MTEPVQKVVISEILCREEFHRILGLNPGLFIIYLTASWCAPCQRVKPSITRFFAGSPDHVACAIVDVDKCSDLYIYLKSKRMVNGVPCVLMYEKGNETFVPNDSVVGADLKELDKFFKRCGSALKRLYIAPPAIRR